MAQTAEKQGFITHNDPASKDIPFKSTHLVGLMSDVTFAELTDVLGKSHNTDDYKSDWEWDIYFDDGRRATVYNYKDGPHYTGDDSIGPDDVAEWHIGGADTDILERLRALFPNATIR